MLAVMNALDQLMKHAASIEAKIGYKFIDRSLLVLAFTHRSYVNENRDIIVHNERLEFLGDAVLGLLISEYLYHHLPHTPEGDLSYLRSRLIEASSCMSYVAKLEIDRHLLLGKGERLNDGRGRESILGDFFEALIGAIYVDGGLIAASKFLFSNFLDEIEATIKTPLHNWKAMLQDYCQKKFQRAPNYKVIHESGPDHSKKFNISVFMNEKELGRGIGASKKEAQQDAAKHALQQLTPAM